MMVCIENADNFNAVTYIYSQTCVKQPPKGSTKSGCLELLLSGYQYKVQVWEHSVSLLKTGWLLNKGV